MTIKVLNTYPAMREILRAPHADRTALLKAMVESAAGMYRYFPGDVDLVAMHAMSSGFPLDSDEERCLEALGALREADAWNRIQRAPSPRRRRRLPASRYRISPSSSSWVIPVTSTSWARTWA
ncbi:hypothetical protein [Amycolatopsis sp. cmx-11-32]|uniref:hypothetical protein n=1 Tax=Amycolatopsis sp. cmx-11-32 TaxID=2785796 RepID=UPI0039E56D18